MYKKDEREEMKDYRPVSVLKTLNLREMYVGEMYVGILNLFRRKAIICICTLYHLICFSMLST